jgi:hypothetical protein
MSFFPLSNVPEPVFSPHLSLTRKKMDTSSECPSLHLHVQTKKKQGHKFWLSDFSTLHRPVTGRFSDLSDIQNNIGMEHHGIPLSYMYKSKIKEKPKH